MGRQALVRHANGKKHKLHVNQQMFSKPKKVIVLDPETVQTSGSSSQDTEQTIDLMLNDSARRKSEIIWALKYVCSGYSTNSSSDINKVFSTMFLDSKIAQNVQLGPDKLKLWDSALLQKCAKRNVKKVRSVRYLF